MKFDIANEVTQKIVSKLELAIASGGGCAPWAKPWIGGIADHPRSGATGKNYRGINAILLGLMGYESPYWFTFKQAKTLCAGENPGVRRGEKGTMIVFFQVIKKETGNRLADGTAETRGIPLLRYYTVFNADQINGLPDKYRVEADLVEDEFSPIEAAEIVVENFTDKPPICHTGGKCYYTPATDSVTMVAQKRFSNPEEYYQTLFHELVHSTGHASRLNRPEVSKKIVFSDSDYSAEELVAEIGASFLSIHCGLTAEPSDNSIAYLRNWIKVLSDNPKMIIYAAARADKAVQYILGGDESEVDNEN